MAFENRHGNSYYYRKKRDGNRVISEYLGCGELAYLIAQFDEIEQLKKKFEQEKEAKIRQKINEKSVEIEKLHKENVEIIEFVLISLGFHQHKRQWRKKRNAKFNSDK